MGGRRAGDKGRGQDRTVRRRVRAGMRRLAGIVIRARPIQIVVLFVLGQIHRSGRVGRIAAAAGPALPLSPESRRHSVECLVDLHFGIVSVAPVELHLEIGAKDAAASTRAALLPSVAEAIAFEANPSTYERFAERSMRAGVTYEHLALGDHDGTIQLFTRARKNGRSAANGRASTVAYPWSRRQLVVDVPVRTLDSYLVDRFAGRDGTSPNGMWIDVEGAHAAVLRGAASALEQTQVALIEVEDEEVFSGQEWLADDVTRHLTSYGLVPVARDAQSRHQFNVVYVRATLLDDPAVRSLVDHWRRDLLHRPPR